jgi:probable HAF family extracellular repeat protein
MNTARFRPQRAIHWFYFLMVCLVLQPGWAQTHYGVIDLGALPGDLNSTAAGISNRPVIAATSINSGVFRAFLWNKGRRKALGTLGGSSSFAFAVNRDVEIVGQAALAGDAAQHAFLWVQDTISDLGALGGENSVAFDISNQEQIVGQAETPDIDPFTGFPVYHAFFWQSGVMTDLGGLGGNNSSAQAIDLLGRVTGFAETSTVPDPLWGVPPVDSFVWQNGTMTDLGKILGGNFNSAYAINKSGWVAGNADLPGDLTARAFLWAHGTATQLGTLPGDTISAVLAINNRGRMVGISAASPDLLGPPALSGFDCPCHAFVIEGGKMWDLNLLIPSDSGWDLLIATDIDDRGEIVGQGMFNGHFRAFLLHPVAVPTQAKPASAIAKGSSSEVTHISLPKVGWQHFHAGK